MFQNDWFFLIYRESYDALGLYYNYLQHVEFYLEIIPERISNR